MILKMNKFLLLVTFLLTQTVISFSQKSDMDCKEIVVKSLRSIKEVKGLKYHLKITERGKKGFNYYKYNTR